MSTKIVNFWHGLSSLLICRAFFQILSMRAYQKEKMDCRVVSNMLDICMLFKWNAGKPSKMQFCAVEFFCEGGFFRPKSNLFG